jgi:hypothetical protein
MRGNLLIHGRIWGKYMPKQQNQASLNQGPQIDFTWGSEFQEEKFMYVEERPDGLMVTMHPGLSHKQVRQAASNLGEHGLAVIQAWERQTGFTA